MSITWFVRIGGAALITLAVFAVAVSATVTALHLVWRALFLVAGLVMGYIGLGTLGKALKWRP